jgi:hypothetical protein
MEPMHCSGTATHTKQDRRLSSHVCRLSLHLIYVCLDSFAACYTTLCQASSKSPPKGSAGKAQPSKAKAQSPKKDPLEKQRQFLAALSPSLGDTERQQGCEPALEGDAAASPASNTEMGCASINSLAERGAFNEGRRIEQARDKPDTFVVVKKGSGKVRPARCLEGSLYDFPLYYDWAFGYRDYEAEVRTEPFLSPSMKECCLLFETSLKPPLPDQHASLCLKVLRAASLSSMTGLTVVMAVFILLCCYLSM